MTIDDRSREAAIMDLMDSPEPGVLVRVDYNRIADLGFEKKLNAGG
jgi:hypothetical protein